MRIDRRSGNVALFERHPGPAAAAALENDRPTLLTRKATRIEPRKWHIYSALYVPCRIFGRFPYIDDQCGTASTQALELE